MNHSIVISEGHHTFTGIHGLDLMMDVFFGVVSEVSDREVGQCALLSFNDDLLEVASEVVDSKVVQVSNQVEEHYWQANQTVNHEEEQSHDLSLQVGSLVELLELDKCALHESKRSHDEGSNHKDHQNRKNEDHVLKNCNDGVELDAWLFEQRIGHEGKNKDVQGSHGQEECSVVLIKGHVVTSIQNFGEVQAGTLSVELVVGIAENSNDEVQDKDVEGHHNANGKQITEGLVLVVEHVELIKLVVSNGGVQDCKRRLKHVTVVWERLNKV